MSKQLYWQIWDEKIAAYLQAHPGRSQEQAKAATQQEAYTAYLRGDNPGAKR